MSDAGVCVSTDLDPAAKMYAEWTGKACRADKIEYELRVVDPMDLEAKLHEANRDPSVHGIMIYYPVSVRGAF